jgi:hypothetical protein
MPRIALVCLGLVGAGCAFSGNYDGVRLTCSDGMCPAGLECREDINRPHGECREMRMDSGIDMLGDGMMMDGDAPPSAQLLCLDPGILTSGVSVSGSTMGRSNTVTSQCNGGVMNAPDAVYKITTSAPNKQLNVAITNTTLNAYVIAPCSAAPAIPTCLGTTAAANNSPINVTATAVGAYYVVVDAVPSTSNGGYTLTVTIQ